jgi:hypothetical protein
MSRIAHFPLALGRSVVPSPEQHPAEETGHLAGRPIADSSRKLALLGRGCGGLGLAGCALPQRLYVSGTTPTSPPHRDNRRHGRPSSRPSAPSRCRPAPSVLTTGSSARLACTAKHKATSRGFSKSSAMARRCWSNRSDRLQQPACCLIWRGARILICCRRTNFCQVGP